MASKGHPGFNAVRDQIARRSGIPKANAAAILAKSSRNASPSAKKANPKLLKVGGAKKSGGKKATPAMPKRRGPTKPTEVHVHVHMPAGGMPQGPMAAPGGAMEGLLNSIGGNGNARY